MPVLRPRFPDDVTGIWKWIAIAIAIPVIAWEATSLPAQFYRAWRARRRFRRLDPVQLTQVIIEVIANDPVLRSTLRAALASDYTRGERVMKGRR